MAIYQFYLRFTSLKLVLFFKICYYEVIYFYSEDFCIYSLTNNSNYLEIELFPNYSF